MQGIGETILAAPAVEGLQAVLVNPGVPVSTAGIFRSLNIEPGAGYRDGLGDPGPAGSHIRLDWLAGCRNDLEAPARQLQPVIGEVIDALAATPNCRLARMSGSGATCFGIFENPADAASAARRLSQAHPGWWVQASRLA
jgi:4-diphosphocytidyl-2-C-methyl-D-erythritol kinase